MPVGRRWCITGGVEMRVEGDGVSARFFQFGLAN